MLNFNFSLQLNISSQRDRNRGTDDWLKEQIEAANQRTERKNRKLARRELDAEIVKTQSGKFWAALVASLKSNIEQFNGARASEPPVEISEREESNRVWITTPDYPSVTLFLCFREGMYDIEISITLRETSRSVGDKVLGGTLDFDVDDNGNIMLRDNGKWMDVNGATQYLLKKVFPYISSGM